jgi:hypothetical protein
MTFIENTPFTFSKPEYEIAANDFLRMDRYTNPSIHVHFSVFRIAAMTNDNHVCMAHGLLTNRRRPAQIQAIGFVYMSSRLSAPL